MEDSVVVPNILGCSVVQAVAILEAADLTYSTNPSRQSEQSGTVASVSPAIGSQVSPETKSSRGS
jgi:beta-lactam-binding protein with PASTA domain